MKAINYYLVVEKIKEEKRTVGGFILTEDLDDAIRYTKAKVISVGNATEGIEEGDVIFYDKHAGHGIQYKELLYHVIKQMDVVLIDNNNNNN